MLLLDLGGIMLLFGSVVLVVYELLALGKWNGLVTITELVRPFVDSHKGATIALALGWVGASIFLLLHFLRVY